VHDPKPRLLLCGAIKGVVEHPAGVGVHRVDADGHVDRCLPPSAPGVGDRDRPAVHRTGHCDGSRPVRQAAQPGASVVLEHQQACRTALLDQDRADGTGVARGHHGRAAPGELRGQRAYGCQVVDGAVLRRGDVEELQGGAGPLGLVHGVAQPGLAVGGMLDGDEDAERRSRHMPILHSTRRGRGTKVPKAVTTGPVAGALPGRG
jgi:hypothetical protein